MVHILYGNSVQRLGTQVGTCRLCDRNLVNFYTGGSWPSRIQSSEKEFVEVDRN
jgi:hypothetical protein